ncbi:unnamed protein product [Rangifer tarandus platyrhynchus]|uniref:Uncharacterized protein n=1 Tax=Rangifer tarandus platyrhynchus TaxID=3082113 RepID=A0AC59YSX6_RANTA
MWGPANASSTRLLPLPPIFPRSWLASSSRTLKKAGGWGYPNSSWKAVTSEIPPVTFAERRYLVISAGQVRIPPGASTAAALVAGLGAEGAELALPAPSLFHVNNKYSHQRPRLVCAPRLPILRPRPFTPRGAAAGIAPGIANRLAPTSHLGKREEELRGAGAPGFRCLGAARVRAGTGSLSRRIPSPRYIISVLSDAGNRNVNSSDF